MQYLIIISALIFILWYFRQRKKQNTLPENYINMYIIFSEPPVLDCEMVAQKFKQMWKSEAACGPAENLGALPEGDRSYIIGNGTHNLRIITSQNKLPEALINIAAASEHGKAVDEIFAIRNHKGFIAIDYLLGPNEASPRVEFSARVLLILAALKGSLGYFNISAVLFRPRAAIERFMDRVELTPEDLYYLFSNVHTVLDNGTNWMHTHGLEQFGVPDLEARYNNTEDDQYYLRIISNGAIYMLVKGPILKPGNTAELGGDGTIFKIKSAKYEADHPFGAMGCLEIVR